MIKHMQTLAQVQNALQNSSKMTQFNATLPIKLEVLEKLQGIRYMLKIGNITMETKSLTELQVGGKYWATMGKDNLGAITLSNLIKQPNIIRDSNIPLRLSAENMKLFLQSDNPFEAMKSFLTDRLAHAESKWEFAFLSHMLMSLKHKVLTLPLRYDDSNKDGLMQLRKKKVQEQECLEFYAVFTNLGATSGLLWDFTEGVRLDINVMYESVASLLRHNLDSLAFIKETHISLNKNILPLYEFHNHLLDLEG